MDSLKQQKMLISALVVIAAIAIGYYFGARPLNAPSEEKDAGNSIINDQASSGEKTAITQKAAQQSAPSPKTATNAPTGQIRVTTPNGGEWWQWTRQYRIEWTHAKTMKTLAYDRVRVELVKGSGASLVVVKKITGYQQSILAAPTQTDWVVTSDVPEGDDYRIRVVFETSNRQDFGANSFQGYRYEDMSDAPFSITAVDTKSVR